MVAAKSAGKKSVPPMGHAPAKPKPISWETFEKKYLSREDKYKYEWVNGQVEKTERTMNQYQTVIAATLLRAFFKLFAEKKVTGFLTQETDTFFLPNIHRRPDLCWFSDDQLALMAKHENQVPTFVIEIISKNDQINKLKRKLKNYEDAGVQVVWLIYPALEEVEVCHGVKSITYRGDETISAAPVLPVFELSVAEVFKKPA